MAILVSCPECKTKYRLSESVRGRKLKCKSCQFTFRAGPKPSPANKASKPRAPKVPTTSAVPALDAIDSPHAHENIFPVGHPGEPVAFQPVIDPLALTPLEGTGAMTLDPLTGLPVAGSPFTEPTGQPMSMTTPMPTPMPMPMPMPMSATGAVPVHRPRRRQVAKTHRPKHKKKASPQFNVGAAVSAGIGFVIMAVGILATIASFWSPNGAVVLFYGAIIGGLVQMCYGLSKL